MPAVTEAVTLGEPSTPDCAAASLPSSGVASNPLSSGHSGVDPGSRRARGSRWKHQQTLQGPIAAPKTTTALNADKTDADHARDRVCTLRVSETCVWVQCVPCRALKFG